MLPGPRYLRWCALVISRIGPSPKAWPVPGTPRPVAANTVGAKDTQDRCQVLPSPAAGGNLPSVRRQTQRTDNAVDTLAADAATILAGFRAGAACQP